ncbi:MAG: methyltransferase domain-containing protein [Candidatus Aenigmatarchaeota archaeon]|nr:MAG: methyltransferase domain-containing protein [Candidatus Aenigmarchaeota archaeon]
MKWREEVFRDVFSSFFPEEKPESVIDIGGGQSEVERILKPRTYVNVNKRVYSGERGEPEGAGDGNATPDIDCDLNEVKRLPADGRSYDVVVLSQILEHLNFDAQQRIIKESKRIARRHIVVGLPNEVVYFQRLLILAGRSTIGVSQFGHHYMFNVPLAEKFVRENFAPEFSVVRTHYVVRGPLRHLPFAARFARLWSNMLAYEIYYLLERKEEVRQ